MTKEKVLTLLGDPAERTATANGLTVEIYSVQDAQPLILTGCIYDRENILVGQSFVFQGNAKKEILARLKQHGFTPLPGEVDPRHWAGFDDDTGRPLVAVIEEKENLTTITTFEKSFYEAQAK
jgi:hypothetical protein